MDGPGRDAIEIVRRPGRAAAGAALLAVIGVVGFAGIASVHSVAGRVFFGLVVVLDAVAVVRMARSGVVVGPSGLVVRDTLRTRHIAWDDVEYISPPSDDPAFRAVGVVTRHGRIRCSALGALRFESAQAPRVRRPYARLSSHFETARKARHSASPDRSA